MSREKKKPGRQKPAPKRTGKSENLKIKKSEVTRERILTAARKVFARHQYGAASLRMVGKEGGFEHALIRYHFPSKEELFKTIISGICEDFYYANESWLEKVNRMPPREGLARYIEYFQAYNAEKPETLRILVQHISLLDDPDALPAYDYITDVLAETRKTLTEKLGLKGSDGRVQRFQDSFNGLLLYYLGASACQARLLGMDPAGKPYQRWVRKTLVSVFLPLLKSIIAGLDEPEGNP